MGKRIIRSDTWPLSADSGVIGCAKLTQKMYRDYCRALIIVIHCNWDFLSRQKSFAAAVERLMHPTKANPSPRHLYFHRRFYKFPSYLRRAAIEFARGQVESFITRYDEWLDNPHRKGARPPRLNPESGCYPVLYRGQLIKYEEDGSVSLKLFNGKEWAWMRAQVRGRGKRHMKGALKSPGLITRKGKFALSVPIECVVHDLASQGKVCAVDMGINTLATASIVSADGTVAGQRFFHAGADIDHLYRLLDLIRAKARLTRKLDKGFCRHLHLKVKNISEQLAQRASRCIVQHALDNGAHVMVMEDLKYWRPRAGERKSHLRKRFHTWQHRRLFELISEKFEEAGGRVFTVYPRATSSYAYDGSGRLRRDSSRYELATFASGKRYNADLNASDNIGARYWVHQHDLNQRKGRNDPAPDLGKSSRSGPRTPVTLSTLRKIHASQVVESEAPHLCAA